MNRLDTMATFVEIVNQNSFTIAARTIGISRALVSRHISDLEGHLGAKLLVRTTRSISLTEAGRGYFDFCSRILNEITAEEASFANRNEGVEGRISVIVPKWIGTIEVADAVAAFSRQYPKIRIEMVLGRLSEKTYDFIERGFDVALQTHDIPNSMIMVKKISNIHYVIVGSPELIEERGMPALPRDFAQLPCVTHTADPVWHLDEAGVESASIKVNSVFASNAHLVLRRVALKGLGFALLPRQTVREDIEAGSLVAVLPQWRAPERPLYVSYAPGGPPPRKVRTFTDFLVDWFRQHPIE